jgi:hypothetical protein
MKTYGNSKEGRWDSSKRLLNKYSYVYRQAVLTRRLYISSTWRSVQGVRTLRAVAGSAKDIRQKDRAQVGVERLWWPFYVVWRPSSQEIQMSCHLPPPTPNDRLLLVITVIKPSCFGSYSDQTSFQSSFLYLWALGKHCLVITCRHPHILLHCL